MADEQIVKEILGWQKSMEEVRQPWDDQWVDIERYLHVLRTTEERRPGPARREGQRVRIYNSAGIEALDLFTNGVYGHMISPTIKWFRLQMAATTQPFLADRSPQARAFLQYPSRYARVDEIPEVRMWLQDTAQYLYEAFRACNFYEAMVPIIEDAAGIGTSTTYVDDNLRRRRAEYIPCHPREVYIAEDAYGRVNRVHRRVLLTVSQAVERFGAERLSENLRSMFKTKPLSKHPFLHAVFERKNRDTQNARADQKPWASYWLELGSPNMATQKGARNVVRKGGYERIPYVVWRYKKSTHETYGRCPGINALPDVLAAQVITKTLLGAAELAVDPAYNVPAEMRGKVKIRPKGFNFYGDDHNRIVTPVYNPANYPIGTDREDRIRDAIRAHYHVEFFLLLTSSERQMTATEVLEKAGEKAAILAPMIARLKGECIDDLFDRQFDIEWSYGRIPPPPPVLLEFAGAPIEIDYLGPLAQAQKRLFQLQGITTSLGQLAPIAAMRPEIMDNIDFDEAARDILEANAFPQRAMRDLKEVIEIRRQRDQMAQQARQAEEANEGAETIRKLSEADRNTEGALRQALTEVAGGAGS